MIVYSTQVVINLLNNSPTIFKKIIKMTLGILFMFV